MKESYSETDWDMWLRISRDFQFEYISEPLVNYSVHEDQLSNNRALVAKGREQTSSENMSS